MGLFFNVERPVRGGYREIVKNHLPLALLTGAILLAAWLLPWEKFPKLCVISRLTDYPCLSCGYTRGFADMAHGDWAGVLHACPIAALLYALTALMFAWNAAALVLGMKIGRGSLLQLKGRAGIWILAAFLTLVVLNWFYRLMMGMN